MNRKDVKTTHVFDLSGAELLVAITEYLEKHHLPLADQIGGNDYSIRLEAGRLSGDPAPMATVTWKEDRSVPSTYGDRLDSTLER